MIGRRVRDRLVGRHEFRCLVEGDPERGTPPDGRSIPGSGCIEFVQVAYGARESARMEAVAAVRARVAAEMPGGTVLAVLDGGPPAEPEPPLHLLKGNRPRLLVVGGEDEHEVQRRRDRVARLWGLRADGYSIRPISDRVAHRRRIVGLACAGPFGIPLFALLLVRALRGLEPGRALPQLLGTDPGLLAYLLALALVPGVAVALWYGWHRSWPTGDSWIVAVSPLVLAAVPLVPAGLFEGVGWLNRNVPGFGVVLICAVAIAALPLLTTYVDAPAWRAALGWGLPLLAGGIATFVGELLLERYLGRFGIARTDVHVSFWTQWLLGAAATVGCGLGIYIGVALWAVFRRMGQVWWLGVVTATFVGAIYFLTMVQAVDAVVADRARVAASGLPQPLFGLVPQLACVEAPGGTYSYVGRPVDPGSGPVVYFGRADGRLAVWSPGSGGVLLDGQAAALRFVQPGATCG